MLVNESGILLCFWDEVLTKWRYTNVRPLPLPLLL